MPQKTAAAATKFVAHLSTSGKVDVIENWLTLNAKGRWAIRTEGISDDLSTKRYELVFSEKSDYLKFRSRFVPKAAS